MKSAKKGKKRIKKISQELTDTTRVKPVRKWLTWFGWGVAYIVVFYLGNLSGEYVAAHMPIYSWHLPKISINLKGYLKTVKLPKVALPNVSVSVNTDSLKKPADVSNVPASNKPTTKTVVISGNVLAVPAEGAADQEQAQFYSTISSLAVAKTNIQISELCEFEPAFISVKKGDIISFMNTSKKAHSINVHTAHVILNPDATVQSTIEESNGIYAFSCDGAVSGYFISK